MNESIAKQGIAKGQFTFHADRGSPMIAKPVTHLLAHLGVTESHSRPHVRNDKPYSESEFRTVKYRPNSPNRVGSFEDAQARSQHFMSWNHEVHVHSGIGYHTPTDLHYGRAKRVRELRGAVLLDAYALLPERFVREIPTPPALPTEQPGEGDR
jgi:putative transposase